MAGNQAQPSDLPARPLVWEEAKGDRTLSFLHVDEIQEAPENPRQITPERFAALQYALDQDPGMMLARPVIVDSRNHQVVAGNMRLRAVKELGWTEIPCYVKTFRDDAQRREWMLRDNQEYGEYVPDELAALVATHEAAGEDLRLLGFDKQTLEDLRKLGGNDVPDLPEPGDADTEEPPAIFGVVIDCETEEEQASLLEEFEGRGMKVRALL